MCMGCWQEMGSPTLDSPQIREAADLIRQVYDRSGVGGNLHVVVDDWNLNDHSLKFCSEQIDAGGYKKPNPDEWDRAMEPEPEQLAEQLAVERRCCDALMALTEDERGSALAIHDRFFQPEPQS